MLYEVITPGKFLPATDYATGFRSSSIAIGDLDGDGRMDLAVANPVTSGSNGSISILLQDTGNPGVFLPAVNYPGRITSYNVCYTKLLRITPPWGTATQLQC